jgi:MFS family permease
VIGGGIVGGLIGLAVWLFVGQTTALAIMVGIGGIIAMIVAIAAGVWAGAYSTLGKDAVRHSSFTWWVVNRLFFFAAITSIQGFVAFFLMYSFGITREAAAALTGNLLMAVGAFSLVSALLGGWLSYRFGYQRSVGISGLLATAGTVVLLVTIWAPNLLLIYVAGAILGFAAGLFTTANWALGTSLVPTEEAGRYLGVSNLAGAGAGMVGTGLGGLVADYLNGYYPGLGYFTIFAGYAILFILSVFSLRWVAKGNK